MYRFKLFFLIVFLLFGSCAYYNTLFNAKKSYNDGLEEIRKNPDQTKLPASAKKNFETTIEKCWKLIELFTDQSKYADDALLYICKSEFQVEKFTQARNHLEQFINKYPKSNLLPEAYLWYGKVLLEEKQIEKANENFIRVIEGSSDAKIRSRANFELGRYAFENERYDEAIDYLERALKEKIDKKFKAFLLYYLGEAYFTQEKYDEAVNQYKKVEKFSPALDIEYKSKLNLSKSYTHLNKHNNAYQVLRKMLTAPRFGPFIPIIKTTMGENEQIQENYLEAIEIYREVILEKKRGPGTAQAAFNLAKLYENYYQNIDSAVTYYEQVGKLYSQFDSVEVANDKKKFLSEYKEIRESIRYDARLVYRLTNDKSFRDSLYYAQYIDSLKIARGEIDTTQLDSTLTPEDSLLLAVQDSLDKVNDPFGNNPFNENQNDEKDNVTNPNDESNLGNTNSNDQNKPAGENNPFGESGDFPGSNKKKKDKDKEDDKKKRPLEKRKLAEIEFDLMNSHYHLAEFYLLKVARYDSALYHYDKFLKTYEDSILSPKALYSMIYIHKTPAFEDLSKVYDLEKRILQDYVYSTFAQEILEDKGMLEEKVPEKTEEEKVAEAFVAAEALHTEGKYQQAIDKYQEIAKLDSTWEISAKAQYVSAWIYEYELENTDAAMTAYQRLVDYYPSARNYVTVARKKVSPPPPERSAAADSALFAANQAAPDSTALADNDTDPDTPVDIQSEDILKEKIQWRNQRRR